jgi:hypothetical protein
LLDLLDSAPERSPKPFFSRRRSLLVSANDAGIDHDVPVLTILQQVSEDPVPDARCRPSREALVRRLVLAIALRHVSPAHPGAQHPQHPMHKTPIILRGPPYRPSPPWQQPFDPTPLHLRQLITTNAHPPTATNIQHKEKTICRYTLEHFPC